MTEELVLVSGVTGYLGSHVAKVFLEHGYRVRGTVRNLQNESKLKPIRDLSLNCKHQIELVQADLLDENSWKDAVNGCTLVAHVASPLPIIQPKDEQDILKPAINGTLSVLKACLNTTVRRVVVTSSSLAITGAVTEDNRVYTEDDWGDANTLFTYCKSKILAERAAWDFVKQHKNAFELVVVNPSFIFGPVLTQDFGLSVEIFLGIINGKDRKIPNWYISLCDVRDVALAHLKALIVPEAAGKRLPVVSIPDYVHFKQVAEYLVKQFGSNGYTIATECDGQVITGQNAKIDDTNARRILQFTPRSLEATYHDTAVSLIERNLVKKS